MPQQLTRQNVLAAFRANSPNLAQYSDDDILRVIGEESPTIIRRLVESGDTDAARFRADPGRVRQGVQERPDDIRRLVPEGQTLMAGYRSSPAPPPQAPPAETPDQPMTFFSPEQQSAILAAIQDTGEGPKKPPAGGTETMKRQAAQIPKGLLDLAASFSPIRFREGITSPTLEVPEAVQNMATMVGQSLTGNAMGMMNSLGAMAQPFRTTAQGAGALAEAYDVPGFHGMYTPSPEEFEAATRGMTQNAAMLALADAPAIGRGIQGAATRAGIPQELARMGTAPAAESPSILSRVFGHPLKPLMRGASRALYDPPYPPIEGQFVDDLSYNMPTRYPVTVPYGYAAEPPGPTPPPLQLTGSRPKALGPAPAHPELQAAPGRVVQPTTYVRMTPEGPYPPPGTMGKIRLGEQGGIPKRGEQTVTGVKAKPQRTPKGSMRKGTEEDVLKEKGTAGRTARELPKPKPTKKKPPAAKPEPPKKP